GAWPAQLSVRVAALAPPLYASTCSRCRLAASVTMALFRSGPLKLTLFVENRSHGRDRYHAPLPQSATPAGYEPINGRSGFDRSSKVIVVPAVGGVGVGVGVGVGMRVGLGLGVAVAVGVGVGVGVGVEVGVAVGVGVAIG